MAYDDTTNLPVEKHQAPDSIDKADPAVLLGVGIEVDGHVFTEAKVKFVGGMSELQIPNPPKRGQCRSYVVKAQCKRYLIDDKGEEPRLILEMEHFVVYDQELGPLNDRQRVGTPEELDDLAKRQKEDPDAGVVDPRQISIDDVEDSDGDYGDDTSTEPEEPQSTGIAGPTDIFSNR